MTGQPPGRAGCCERFFGWGWTIKRQRGSHRTLSRPGSQDYVFAFHDNEELGPRMLVRIAKHTGLRPDDL
jgi:predicted RNA binding protein YcfA (HicA-like mRNA interferase family)